MSRPPASGPLQLRLRIYAGAEPALGPGRIDLLERIDGTESIARAARDMGMSYMKAWKLIQSLNRCFAAPLLEVHRGGKAGGTAQLTPLGREIIALYRRMEHDSLAAIRPLEEKLIPLLRPIPEP